MIDKWAVAANSLWILGFSILLAAFSYHDWLARERGRRRRDLFKERSFQLSLMSSLFLTCVGWGCGQADRWWAKALWLGLAAPFGWQMLVVMAAACRRSKAGSRNPG